MFQGTALSNAALRSIIKISQLQTLTLPETFATGNYPYLENWTKLPQIKWVNVINLSNFSRAHLDIHRPNVFVSQKLREIASSNFLGLFEKGKDLIEMPLDMFY